MLPNYSTMRFKLKKISRQDPVFCTTNYRSCPLIHALVVQLNLLADQGQSAAGAAPPVVGLNKK